MDLKQGQVFSITKTYFGMRFRLREDVFTSEVSLPDHVIEEAIDLNALARVWAEVLEYLLASMESKIIMGEYRHYELRK